MGSRLAARSQPQRIGRLAKGESKSTLVIRIASGQLAVLQHQAPLIVERINTFFGWALPLRLVHGRLPPPPPPSPPPAPTAGPAWSTPPSPASKLPLAEALRTLAAACGAPRRVIKGTG